MPKIDTAKQNADFHSPEVIITVNGKKLSAEGINISETKTEQIIDGASLFSFTIPQALDDKFVSNYAGVIQFGDKIEISYGYKDRLFPVITGIVTALSWGFDEDNYLDLMVEGYDYLFLMMKNEKYRAWNNKTDAQVIKEITQKYPFQKLNIENTAVQYPHIRQEGESDFNFLKRLARRNGYEFSVEEENFTFGLPGVDKKESFVLKFGKDLLEFVPKMDIAQQVSEVRVVGWDPEAKKEIIAHAKKVDIKNVDRHGKTGLEIIKSVFKEEVVHEVRASVQESEEAKNLAKSILHDISYQFVKAECRSIGIPALRPGKVIALENVGELFSRKYYIEKVTHEIGEKGYETSFLLKGNSCNESY